MKVIVTGSCGMLGTDLVTMLQKEHDVIGCDLPHCNILNYDQFDTFVSTHHPDVIVHTAAYTNVDRAESDEHAAMQLNAVGTQYVATVAKRQQAKVVYISTDYVLDGTQNRPYDEEASPHPLGVYGKTKLKGEQHIQHILGPTQDFLIVRTAWLYGRHGKNFVSAILQRAQQQDTLDVVNDQTGSPTYTKDLARGIIALLRHNAAGIVHITNSGRCTWYDFANTILDYAGLSHVTVIPITTEELQRPAPRPKFSVLDTTKFSVLTGQKIQHWKQGLQEYFSE